MGKTILADHSQTLTGQNYLAFWLTKEQTNLMHYEGLNLYHEVGSKCLYLGKRRRKNQDKYVIYERILHKVQNFMESGQVKMRVLFNVDVDFNPVCFDLSFGQFVRISVYCDHQELV